MIIVLSFHVMMLIWRLFRTFATDRKKKDDNLKIRHLSKDEEPPVRPNQTKCFHTRRVSHIPHQPLIAHHAHTFLIMVIAHLNQLEGEANHSRDKGCCAAPLVPLIQFSLSSPNVIGF